MNCLGFTYLWTILYWFFSVDYFSYSLYNNEFSITWRTLTNGGFDWSYFDISGNGCFILVNIIIIIILPLGSESWVPCHGLSFPFLVMLSPPHNWTFFLLHPGLKLALDLVFEFWVVFLVDWLPLKTRKFGQRYYFLGVRRWTDWLMPFPKAFRQNKT